MDDMQAVRVETPNKIESDSISALPFDIASPFQLKTFESVVPTPSFP
jgi:hypothetical protein